MAFTRAVAKQIFECVMEGRVKRLTRVEMHALILSRTQKDVSIAYIDYLIKKIKKQSPSRLAELKESKYAFLDEVFKSQDEIERMIQEAWRIFHLSEHDRYLQLNCIRELHALTITRSNIIDVIPHVTATEVIKKPNATAIQSNLAIEERRANQKIF